MQRSLRWWRLALLSIPMGVYVAIVAWPLLDSFYYSVTNWNGFSADYRIVGLDNFRALYSDPLVRGALRNTLVWTVAAALLPNLLGLALAIALERHVPGSRVFKSIFYLPVCLSAVVVGQIWVWIYQPDWGALNGVLGALGAPQSQRAWLAEPGTALYAIIVAWSWQQTGLSMVIYLAGLTSVPQDLIEAAALDGAGYWRRLWNVVLPMLKPATVVVVALSVINSLKGFDIVYIMTGGGPFHTSDTLAMAMYDESFKRYRMGYGAAISVLLFLITVGVVATYFRELRKLDELSA
jgi:multiple sugar transport system permease protein/raffinose/stachyose/melibiose transport system permease protein